MKKQLPKVIAIVGPTATGKSDLAVFIAKIFKGEVVSADSRQVYSGLDIGSGKITKKEMKGVPHHLLDVSDVKKIYNVEKFKNDSKTTITEILNRKKIPIIAGGTGFYIDALIFDEQFPEVPPNKALRKKLEKKSTESLMKEIMKLDSERGKALDPHNRVRIIRAIEIAKTLGSVPKVTRRKQFNTLFVGLTLDRESIREKIHKRLFRRMEKGALVREVSNLHKKGVSWKRLYDLGLEYRYLSLYLQKKMTKEEMLEKLEQEIAQFARRQMQWFKRNKDIKWFAPTEKEKVAEEVKRFIDKDQGEE